MRDEVFHLTEDQIEFDSPNYFTTYFSTKSAESQTRTLRLARDPDLFRIIIDYLTGYTILPLHSPVIPRRMSPEQALRNLLVDAEFYRLEGLIGQMTSNENNKAPEIPATRVSNEEVKHEVSLGRDIAKRLIPITSLRKLWTRQG